MKRILGIIGFCLFFGGVKAQISVALQELLHTKGLKNAAIGISVKKVADGKEVIAYNPQMALTPASVAKLIPTWLALREKGEKFRFVTSVYYTGTVVDDCLKGDIVVVAGGDPTPDSRYFPDHSLVVALVKAISGIGIRHIQGKVYVEGSKPATDIPGSWPWEDIANYYAALYLPFNYRDNTYTLHFRSAQAGSLSELVSVTPDLPGTCFRNEVKASAVNKDNAWIFGGPHADSLCVKGNIPANRADFRVKGCMYDPAGVFVAEVTKELARKNISVGQQRTEQTGRTLLTECYSPVLEEIVFHTNKASVNLFAEALGELAGKGDWSGKVKTGLAGAGIDTAGIILKDACGLSPMNALPAEVITGLLVRAGKEGNAAFLRSLPVGGRDAGLAGYCHAFPQLKLRLSAKTGSMSGVRCLAGFLSCKDGQRLAFTIFVNHYTCSVMELQQALGEFLNRLL